MPAQQCRNRVPLEWLAVYPRHEHVRIANVRILVRDEFANLGPVGGNDRFRVLDQDDHVRTVVVDNGEERLCEKVLVEIS